MNSLLSSLKERCNRSIPSSVSSTSLSLVSSSVKLSSCKNSSSSCIRNGSFVIRNGIGFTLVELMIVIAIIGVLAASLFPMMSGYMARARDTARISHLKALETAVFQATNDKGAYLFSDTGQTNWCSTIGSYWRTSFEDRVKEYLTKVPHDPLYTSPVPVSGTGANTDYFYGEGYTLSGSHIGTDGGLTRFILGAHFEGTPPKELTGATWMVGGCFLGPDASYPTISMPYNGIREKKF